MEQKRIQRELDAVLREIRRLNIYYDKEREFLYRPKVGRPHPNTWVSDPEKRALEAKEAARLARMDKTAKKIAELCIERERLKVRLKEEHATSIQDPS